MDWFDDDDGVEGKEGGVGGKSKRGGDNGHKIKAEKVYFFDYNTVETVLLGCAVIVCLSGVMFENERFVSGERTDVLWEKVRCRYG